MVAEKVVYTATAVIIPSIFINMGGNEVNLWEAIDLWVGNVYAF